MKTVVYLNYFGHKADVTVRNEKKIFTTSNTKNDWHRHQRIANGVRMVSFFFLNFFFGENLTLNDT